MKRDRRRPRVGQQEFGFVAKMFNLSAEAALDSKRIAREQAKAVRARQRAEEAKAALFPKRKRR
jgi:hypothetical protein